MRHTEKEDSDPSCTNIALPHNMVSSVNVSSDLRLRADLHLSSGIC